MVPFDFLLSTDKNFQFRGLSATPDFPHSVMCSLVIMAHFTYLLSLNCFFHITEIMFKDQQGDLVGKGICHHLMS